MADKQIFLNRAQLKGVIFGAKKQVDIWGRGSGKSSIQGYKIHSINKYMPRAITQITGQTYGQLLTRTLPSAFKFLEEKLGYVRGLHYVINEKPPAHFKTPYERILRYENFISFNNGNGCLLASQDRAGSSRGPSVDFELVDEALTIDKQRYDEECSPTNRGNEEYFGIYSNNPVFLHHGFHYSSSMPYSNSHWLLKYGEYYREETGVDIFRTWNQIVKLQLELIKIMDKASFAKQWNEILRLKNKIKPFISRNGVLFTLANAFDNIETLGISYIRNQYEKLPYLTFMIEIMNYVPDKIDDCYYNFDSEKHLYYNAYNNSYIADVATGSNYNFGLLSESNSRYDIDCIPNSPLEVCVDWGSNISFLLVVQQHGIINPNPNTINFIKEFFVKPQTGRVMIDDLIDQFCYYYRNHIDKTILYYKDKYGDENRANSSLHYNDQAIKRFEHNAWTVIPIDYKGKEPPHHEKYLMWANICKESESYPHVRINGTNCPNFIIAANNTRVIEKDNKFVKDKSSEHKNSSTPPELATHSTDVADKIVWIKYKNQANSTFIEFKS